jgi:hypothetical protein
MKINFEMKVNTALIKKAQDSHGFIHYFNEAATEFGNDFINFVKGHPFIQGCKIKFEPSAMENKALSKPRPVPKVRKRYER